MSGIKPFPVFKLVGTSIEPIVSGSTLGSSNILVSATDKVLGRESAGAGAVEEISCTSAGRALIDDADTSAQRTTLGLIAGGAGDIWVEKAGDTMTSTLTVDPDTDVPSIKIIPQNDTPTTKFMIQGRNAANDTDKFTVDNAGNIITVGNVDGVDVSTVPGLVTTHAALTGTNAHSAASINTASAIVSRDVSGNFAAGTITASLTGAASLNVLKAGDTMAGVLTQNGANLAGSAYQSQAFQNEIKNGNFESWSAGASAVPDGWSIVGAGASVAQEATIIKVGTYSAKLTRAGANCDIYQSLSNYNYLRGKTVTYGAWVYATVASRVKLIVYDSIGAASSSSYHTGDSTWQFLTVTHTVNSGAISYLRTTLTVDTGDTSGYIDGAILVEGSIVPAFSERPLYDDAKTLFIDSVNNRVGINTATPQSLLDLGSALANRKLLLRGSNQNFQSGLGISETDSSLRIFSQGNSYIQFGHMSTDGVFTFSPFVTMSNVGGSNTNVGIGTVLPATKLDVAGSMQVSSTVSLSLGGYVRTFAEATGTPSGTTTFFDIAVAIPSGAKLLGVQLRVDTELTAGETWGAAYVTGSTTTLAAAGQAVAKNTKVNKMHVDEISTATTNIRITRDAGNFTNAVGVIRAIAYYETFTAMGNAA